VCCEEVSFSVQVMECPPVSLALPGGSTVEVRVLRWVLAGWPGAPEDPPDLPLTWARKPAFLVEGRCVRAEFAILEYLRREGWRGLWVNAFGNELWPAWFPAPASRTPGEAGAPGWAAQAFEELRAANGGKLTGFLDVFAWREPGEVGCFEAKVVGDSIRLSQRAFLEKALRFHPIEQFTIIEIPRPALPGTSRPRAGSARTEQIAVTRVMALERAAGRLPVDVRWAGEPYDISSPPRKIEVKAFSRSARGEVLALEESQAAEARRDPENYYLYVVDHTSSPTRTAVRVIHGDLLAAILDRTPPTISHGPA
jgi:hypothetical protein